MAERTVARIELCALSRRYDGGVAALEGVELAVEAGEFLAVVGPSGSGKTTLLRLIAGLEEPSRGAVWIGNRPVTHVPPHRRGLALVFQQPALYPHLSVYENLAFGLRAQRVPRAELKRRVIETAEILRIEPLLERRPGSLSTGELQRAALGRAIATRPAILLLDEPFSNFDVPLRIALRAELRDLHQRFGMTTILVTHDQEEALALGDRVAVLEAGRLRQVGTPSEVYNRPSCRFVGAFMGDPPMNFLPLDLEHVGRSLRLRLQDVVTQVPDDTAWIAPLAGLAKETVVLGVRPERINLANSRPASAAFLPVSGKLTRLESRGHETLATIEMGGLGFIMRVDSALSLRVGESLSVRIDLARASWFDASSGERLRSGGGSLTDSDVDLAPGGVLRAGEYQASRQGGAAVLAS